MIAGRVQSGKAMALSLNFEVDSLCLIGSYHNDKVCNLKISSQLIESDTSPTS